jgi:hypothetical protein
MPNAIQLQLGKKFVLIIVVFIKERRIYGFVGTILFNNSHIIKSVYQPKQVNNNLHHPFDKKEVPSDPQKL